MNWFSDWTNTQHTVRVWFASGTYTAGSTTAPGVRDMRFKAPVPLQVDDNCHFFGDRLLRVTRRLPDWREHQVWPLYEMFVR